MSPTVPTTPAEIAECIRRLTPCWRDMRKFYRARDDLAAAVAGLAIPPSRPCASCASARHALAAARRDRDIERDHRIKAERLLRTAVRKPRRSRAPALAAQLDLWEREP